MDTLKLIPSDRIVAEASIDGIMRERNYPCSPSAAARAGFEAANRLYEPKLKRIENLLIQLNEYFESGNQYPIEKATIRTDSKEIQELKTLLGKNA